VVIDVAQEDRVATLIGKVGRRPLGLEHYDVRQRGLLDGGGDLGKLRRADVRRVDASRWAEPFRLTTDIAPPPAPTSATVVPGLSLSNSASCGPSRAACLRS
jgi:hypothetical protein